MIKSLILFFKHTFLDLGKQFHISYLPPLMIYVAAGVSGLTGIVGTFFIKDYLNLSAAFLAGLGLWAVLSCPMSRRIRNRMKAHSEK